MKYLVLLGVLLLVYLLWRYQRHTEERERNETARPAPAPSATPALPQEMVECPVCAVHLPRSDALVDASGRTYCCAEHRRKGAA
jgi:uncharacterized protein